jgi:hypothetical protein
MGHYVPVFPGPRGAEYPRFTEGQNDRMISRGWHLDAFPWRYLDGEETVMTPKKWVIPGLALVAAVFPPAIRGADAGTWERTRMPGYAPVQAFASIPAGLLAGTDSGGIFLTGNEGSDWTRVWQAPGNGLAESIRSFLAGDTIILAACGQLVDWATWDCWDLQCTSRPAHLSGMLRSRDGGRTWSLAGLKDVTAMARLRDATILAATLQGFYLSMDWGATWRPITVAPEPGSRLTADYFKSHAVHEIAAFRGDAYFTMSEPGLNRLFLASPGDTAYRVQTVLPGALSVTGSENILFACTRTGILRARTQGSPSSAWDTVSHAVLTRIQSVPGGLLAIPPPTPSYDDFTEGIQQSVDGGVTWTLASPPGSDGVAFIQHKNSLYWGSRRGPVMRCAPGGAWTYASDGLLDMGLTRIALPEGSVLAVLEGRHLLHQVAGPGGVWTSPHSGFGIGSLVTRGKHAFFIEGRQLWSSAQAGAPGSWDSLGLQAPRSVIAGEGWQLVLQSDGLRTLCGSGTCEAPISGDLPAEKYNGLGINNALHGAAAVGDTVYIALDSIYSSYDRGRSFTFQSAGNAWDLAALGGGKLEMIKANGYGDTGEGLNRPHLAVSSDGGRNWSHDLETGIRGPGTLRFLVSRPGELFCAGDSGVFMRKEGQTVWTDLSEGLPSRKIRALAVGGDRLAVAADSGPVWLRDLGPITSGVRAGRGRNPTKAIRSFRDGQGRWRRLDGTIR